MDERAQRQAAQLERQPRAAADPQPDEIRSRVVQGLSWKLATQIVNQGSRTVVGILLAHLLSPHDYGLAAMALVFTALAPVFTDLSLGAALVQRPLITEEDRSTAFWTTVGASLATTATGIAVAPLIADFFNAPRVAALFAITSITFTLSGLSATQFALLNREMAFRSLQIREMAAVLVAAVVGVVTALAGGGPWAIVIQLVVADATSSALVWKFCPWRPRFIFSRRSLRDLGSFGVKTLGTRILVYLRLNLDNLLIGKYVGTRGLGVYAVSYNLMFAPVTRISQPVQQVVFPAFSRLQDDRARLASTWIRGNRLIAAIMIPAFLGMAVVAPDFVPVVLGRRWHAVVPVLQLLSLSGVVLSVEQINSSALSGLGRAGTLLRYMAFSTGVIALAFGVGLIWGVVGVAACYLVASVALAPIYASITTRALGIALRDFAASLAGLVQAALTMGLIVYGARAALVHEHIGAGARVGLLIAIGVAIYSLMIKWRAPDIVADGRSLLGRRLQQERIPAANGLRE